MARAGAPDAASRSNRRRGGSGRTTHDARTALVTRQALVRGGNRRKLLKVVVAMSVWAGVAAPLGTRATAGTTAAAQQNRAVLVVDTGDQVKKVCVRFWEESISGAELLRRAEVDAALRPYAGKGVAVCSLCGVGCRTDDSCLTCDPDGRYWAYSRAPAGTSGFRLSPAGASNTEVRNGDVEGWRWSRGTSPAYISVEEACDGAPPAASATNTTAPAPTSTTVAHSPEGTPSPSGASDSPLSTAMPPTSRAGTAASGATGTRPPSPTTVPPGSGISPAGDPQPGATPSTTHISTDSGTDPGPAAPDVAATANRRPANSERGGSPAGLAAFAGVLAGLLSWAAWARRRRRIT